MTRAALKRNALMGCVLLLAACGDDAPLVVAPDACSKLEARMKACDAKRPNGRGPIQFTPEQMSDPKRCAEANRMFNRFAKAIDC